MARPFVGCGGGSPVINPGSVAESWRREWGLPEAASLGRRFPRFFLASRSLEASSNEKMAIAMMTDGAARPCTGQTGPIRYERRRSVSERSQRFVLPTKGAEVNVLAEDCEGSARLKRRIASMIGLRRPPQAWSQSVSHIQSIQLIAIRSCVLHAAADSATLSNARIAQLTRDSRSLQPSWLRFTWSYGHLCDDSKRRR